MSTLAYVRISRGAKPGDYGSFEFQRDAIERYCAKRGLSDVKWFIDYGSSRFSCPGKQALWEEDREQDVVITGLDRLYRNTKHCLAFVEVFHNVHITDTGKIGNETDATIFKAMKLLERDIA